MQSLIPFVLGAIATDLVLVAVFAVLYRRERRPHLGWWTIAWLLDAIRHGFNFADEALGGHPSCRIAGTLAIVGSAWCLLEGTGAFIGRARSRFWPIASLAVAGWVLVADALDAGFLATMLPPTLFLGAMRCVAGVALVRARAGAIGRVIAGLALIGWGLHAWNYPFLRPIAWFAPWGFQLSGFFGILVAIGTLLLHVEQAREAEARLREELAEAQRLEALGRMAGGIAHDFNNALGTIVAAAELARLRVGRGESADAELADVCESAMRASGLTKQLLALGKREPIARREIDLREIVASSARVLARVLGEPIALDVSLGEVPLVVRVDPGQIDQVVTNLALNARDAMPAGGALRIALERVDVRGRPHARLRIEDRGEGMDEETRRRMFDPFFTTKPGVGHGLGLAMVYGAVTQNDGKLDVKSAPGRGTRVDVLLPIVAEASTREGVTERARDVTTTGARRAARSRATRVLVVEDETALRRSIAHALRESGHEVIAAASAREALARLDGTRARLDLLVTDVVMPGASGAELAREVRLRVPDCPVVYVSGYSADRLDERALDERAELLAKPFTIEALVEAVERRLARTGEATSASAR